MTENKKMLHIACGREDIGKYVLLPGNPDRCIKIAKYLDNYEKVAQNREHTTYIGYIDGEKVAVTSTGMGGPSAAICMEELVRIGAETFIRIGTCASTSEQVRIGDVVIPNASVRMEGTGNHYLPIEFPAVPDYEILKELEKAAVKADYKYHVGICTTRDAFYTQIEPEKKPVGYELINKWNAYQKGGAICTEMESATLFLVASALKVRVATVLVSATNYNEYSDDSKIYPGDTENRAIEIGIEALREIIKADKANSRK